MRLAIVLVHYRTPELARACVGALRADLAATGLDAEIVIVDNGSTPDGRRALESLDVSVLDPGGNVGYGAGATFGIEATAGDPVVVLNPDVLVRPGCLAELVSVLGTERGGGAAIAGPRFFWDEGERLVLPPLEETGFGAELTAALGRAGRRGARRARIRWRRHARRHWQAREPVASHSLSGALLAFTRQAWHRVGPFDPAYRLYFEEADWLERARRLGLPAAYVPAARAVHLYNQSAGHEPAAGGWFAASRDRFRRRVHGPLGAFVLDRAERALRPARPDAEGTSPAGEPAVRELELPRVDGGPVWVEVSPDPSGFPAAGERVETAGEAERTPWCLPPEVDRRLAPGSLWVTVTDGVGRELVRRRLACGVADGSPGTGGR